MSRSVRKATVGAGVRGGGTKVWGGLGWSDHHLLYPPHPRYSHSARQQQHDKVKTFAGVLDERAASLLDSGEKALKIRAGAWKNRHKRSAMCEHARQCPGSPRCPAMLPTKVSGR